MCIESNRENDFLKACGIEDEADDFKNTPIKINIIIVK